MNTKVNKLIKTYIKQTTVAIKKSNIIANETIDTNKRPKKLNNKASKAKKLDIIRINN